MCTFFVDHVWRCLVARCRTEETIGEVELVLCLWAFREDALIVLFFWWRCTSKVIITVIKEIFDVIETIRIDFDRSIEVVCL